MRATRKRGEGQRQGSCCGRKARSLMELLRLFFHMSKGQQRSCLYSGRSQAHAREVKALDGKLMQFQEMGSRLERLQVQLKEKATSNGQMYARLQSTVRSLRSLVRSNV